MALVIPTKSIGRASRPLMLIEALSTSGNSHSAIEALYEEAIRDTVERMAASASPGLTDGEQRGHKLLRNCRAWLNRTSAISMWRWQESRTENMSSKSIGRNIKPDQRVFVGVTAPIAPWIGSTEEVRDSVLEAAAVTR